VNRKLNGDCHTPLGAYASINENKLHLVAMVGTADGSRLIRTQISGDCVDAENIGTAAAEDLLTNGANEILSL
jgi:hydroxymethylbilane synthase